MVSKIFSERRGHPVSSVCPVSNYYETKDIFLKFGLLYYSKPIVHKRSTFSRYTVYSLYRLQRIMKFEILFY